MLKPCCNNMRWSERLKFISQEKMDHFIEESAEAHMKLFGTTLRRHINGLGDVDLPNDIGKRRRLGRSHECR
jgi:hypothetical protein